MNTHKDIDDLFQDIANAIKEKTGKEESEKIIADTFPQEILSIESGGGNASWGQISGRLNDQTDLFQKFNNYSLITDSGNKLALERDEETNQLCIILYDKNDNILSSDVFELSFFDLEGSIEDLPELKTELDRRPTKPDSFSMWNATVFDSDGNLIDSGVNLDDHLDVDLVDTVEVEEIDSTEVSSIDLVEEITPSASDIQVPTALAVKTYVNSKTGFVTTQVILDKDNWSTTAPYEQTIEDSLITIESNPIVELMLDQYSTQEDEEIALLNYGLISYIDTYNGSVKFVCKYGKPEVDLSIQLKGV